MSCPRKSKSCLKKKLSPVKRVSSLRRLSPPKKQEAPVFVRDPKLMGIGYSPKRDIKDIDALVLSPSSVEYFSDYDVNYRKIKSDDEEDLYSYRNFGKEKHHMKEEDDSSSSSDEGF